MKNLKTFKRFLNEGADEFDSIFDFFYEKIFSGYLDSELSYNDFYEAFSDGYYHEPYPDDKWFEDNKMSTDDIDYYESAYEFGEEASKYQSLSKIKLNWKEITKDSGLIDEGNNIDELEFAKTIGNKNIYENLDSLFNKLSDPKTPSIIRKTIIPDISEFRTEILDFARENDISSDNMNWLVAEIKVHSKKTGVPIELYVACFKSLLSELEGFNIAELESLVPEDSIFLTVNPDKETVDKMYEIMKAFVSSTFSKINLIGLLQGNMTVAMKQFGDLKGV